MTFLVKIFNLLLLATLPLSLHATTEEERERNFIVKQISTNRDMSIKSLDKLILRYGELKTREQMYYFFKGNLHNFKEFKKRPTHSNIKSPPFDYNPLLVKKYAHLEDEFISTYINSLSKIELVEESEKELASKIIEKTLRRNKEISEEVLFSIHSTISNLNISEHSKENLFDLVEKQKNSPCCVFF